jgi:hypothetical protein
MLATTCPPEDLTTVDDDGHLPESESAPVEQPGPERTTQVHDRKWPMLYVAGFVGIGLLYMFFWNPVVHHSSSWAIGGDVWGIYRGGQYVLWGDLGGIYNQGTGIIAFPGMSVLLVPVAFVSQHLNLSSSFGPFMLQRPSVGLVLMPFELLLGSSVIFAADALAQKLAIAGGRRIWMCAIVAIVAWPVVAVWGHAEDSLAMAFTLYAMVALLDERWSRVGWLFGLGIVMQPLVLLLLPMLFFYTPSGQRLMLAIRSLVVSAFLVGVAFAGDASDTYRALVKQPTPPSINHATPWVALSPRLNSGAVQTFHGASLHPLAGSSHRFAVNVVAGTGRAVVYVSGGPGRMIDVLAALVIGLVVWRWRPAPARLLWLAAVVLASRCFFEPVMTPYYLAPPLILCLIMAALQSRKRFWAAVILALEVTVFAYHHLNPWAWWLPVVVGLAAVVALGYPKRGRIGSESAPVSVIGELGERPEASSPTEPASAGRDELVSLS